MRGDEAPLASELEAWLEKNPGWEEVPRDEDSDEDSDDEEKVANDDPDAILEKAREEAKQGDDDEKGQTVDYYSIAHTISETVEAQASVHRTYLLKRTENTTTDYVFFIHYFS